MDRLLRRQPYHIVVRQDNVNVEGMDVAELYRTQPNLQAVVSFLADNIAQLPLKVYSRESDISRQRITGNATASLLKRPNPYMTTYELVRATMTDILLYGRCPWLVTSAESESGWQILPIPNEWIIKYEGSNAFAPESIIAKAGLEAVEIPASEFVIFHNYDPTSPAGFVSPVEALSSMLYEQVEAERFRTDVWRNQGRLNSYISRPANVKPWTDGQADRFKRDFREGWAKRGANSGAMPVLEDGMEIKTASFNAKESQWAESKKLTREDVAAIYHVNPSLIWHTDSQTYASAKDNARALYADTLAPMLVMMQQRINAFLLPKIGAADNEYVEFDIQEKLRGSFEEQAQVIQSSVGAPWLTRNEARARQNLPPIEGGDELIVPLNVLEGGLASPTDTTRDNYLSAEPKVKSKGTKVKAQPQEETEKRFEDVYLSFLERQRKALMPKLGAKADWWDEDRWVRELADDLYSVVKSESYGMALKMLEEIGADIDYDFPRTEAYLRKMCEGRSKTCNEKTHALILEALEEDGNASSAFEVSESRAKLMGSALAAGVMSFSYLEGLRQSEEQGFGLDGCTKTWLTTSPKPRPSHTAMNGQTVPYKERFSNGADFPQDRELEAGEACNCRCIVEIYVP